MKRGRERESATENAHCFVMSLVYILLVSSSEFSLSLSHFEILYFNILSLKFFTVLSIRNAERDTTNNNSIGTKNQTIWKQIATGRERERGIIDQNFGTKKKDRKSV